MTRLSPIGVTMVEAGWTRRPAPIWPSLAASRADTAAALRLWLVLW